MEMKQHYEGCVGKEKQRLYRIGAFAQMNHTTIKALRFYEEQGLLLPAYVDGESGYRYYTMDQMAVLHQVTALKQAGFTLEQIKALNQGREATVILAEKRSEILAKIAELTGQLTAVEGLLTGKAGSLESPVLIRTIPAVVCASARCRIASYDDLFNRMPAMGAEMERLGYECAEPEYCFTCYLEPDNQDEQLPVEICQAVTEQKEDSDQLTFREFPEMQAACIYHKGSYRDFPRSYAAVLAFVEENGYEICGGIRERYIDGVWNRDRESDWLSEIQVPVRKIGKREQ